MKRYISSRTRAASEWQPSLAATGVGIRVRGGPAGQPVPRGRGGLGLGRWQAVLGGRAERQDGVDGLAGAVTVVGDAELVIVEGRQVGWQGEAEAVFVLGASPAARRPAGSVVACVDARSAGGVGEPGRDQAAAMADDICDRLGEDQGRQVRGVAQLPFMQGPAGRLAGARATLAGSGSSRNRPDAVGPGSSG